MDELKKLYDGLVADGSYTKSFEDFKRQMQDPSYQDRLYNGLVEDGLFTSSKDDFLKQYAVGPAKPINEPLKKKELPIPESLFPIQKLTGGVSSSGVGSSELPSTKPTQPVAPAPVEQFKPASQIPQDIRNRAYQQMTEVQPPNPYEELTKRNVETYYQREEAKKQERQKAQEQEQLIKSSNLAANKDEQFQKYLQDVNANLIDKGEGDVVPELNRRFSGYGFQFETSGIGDAMVARTADGKHEIEIDLDPFTTATEVAESKRLRDFLTLYAQERMGERDEDYIGKSLRAQQIRDVGMRNDDGSYSTVKFASFEQDGKFFVVPTLFPKDPNATYTTDKKDWMELPLEQAIQEARKRGELFEFGSDEEAKRFAEGDWKKVNAFDIEGQKFYKERGLDYYAEKQKWGNYDKLQDEIDLIDRMIDNKKISPQEKLNNPQYFGKDGRLLYGDDALEKKKEEIIGQKDKLIDYLFDVGFTGGGTVQKAREEFDFVLNERQNEIAGEAIRVNKAAKDEYDILNQTAMAVYNVPIDKINTITPKTAADAENIKSLTSQLVKVKAAQKTAATKFEVAKTYYDAKWNNQANSEYEENWAGFTTAVADAWNNGQAAEQILLLTLGVKDAESITDRQEAARLIAENLGQLSGKQSQVMTRLNLARDGEFMKALLADPAETMLTLAATSFVQMAPYGLYIVPSAIAGGAATGAVYGAATGAVAGGVGAGPGAAGGAVAGGAKGLAVGMAATSLAMEYTNSILDVMREKGYNLMDPKQVEAALTDEAVWSEGSERGLSRGIPIAVVDYLSAGLAGKVFTTSKLATTPVKAAAFVGERLVFDPAAEAAGEYVAQTVAGQEIDLKEIAFEALGGLGNNTSHAALNIYKDVRKNSNAALAYELTDINRVASERVSDERISQWANNMHQLGQIDADVNQRIQQNVGLRRQARELTSIGKGQRLLGDGAKVEGRIMELLAAKEELSATQNRREINRSKISQINNEIAKIAETKKLLPENKEVAGDGETTAVNLDSILGTTREGVSRFTIGGRTLNREQFLKELENMNDRRLLRTRVNIDNDEEVLETYNKRIENAIQKQSPSEVSVQSETGVSQALEEGKPETELEVATQETEEEVKAKEDIVSSKTRLDEIAEAIPERIDYTEDDLVNFDTLEENKTRGVLAALAEKVAEGTKLSETEKTVYDANKAQVDEFSNLVSERTAIQEEVADLEAMLGRRAEFRAEESPIANVETTTNALNTINILSNVTEAEAEKNEGFTLIRADFGRNGRISYEISDAGDVEVLNIERNKGEQTSDKSGAIGEGSMAIASIFNSNKDVDVIYYDDDSEGFWDAIGGKVDTLTREDFFKYYNNKAKSISESYHKAKTDGTNPELVKAVESLVSKPKVEFRTEEKKPRIESDLAKEGTGIKLTGEENVTRGSNAPTVNTTQGYQDDYSESDIMDSEHSPTSRVVTLALNLASGIISYKHQGKLVSFVLPYINDTASKKIESLKEKYKNVKGTNEASKAEKERIKREINKITKQVLREFTDAMTQNLLALYDTLTPEFIAESKMWYVGANRMANAIAEKYNMTIEQVGGIIAVLSPQNDWFNNVSVAERAINIMSQYGDTKITKDIIDKAVEYNTKSGKPNDFAQSLIDIFNKFGEVSINELQQKGQSILIQSSLLRAFDQGINSPKVAITDPTGKFVGFDKTPVRWNSETEIAKAITIFRDGNIKNVNENLGNGNKVRNFYNNIVDPNSKTPYLTADTHALSAALNSPISANDATGFGLFKGSLEPAYALVKSAYINAAKIAGIMPREMQSITWEAQRVGINNKSRTAEKKNELFNYIREERTNNKTPYERATELIARNRSQAPEWGKSRGVETQRTSDEIRTGTSIRSEQRVSDVSNIRGLAGRRKGDTVTGLGGRTTGRQGSNKTIKDGKKIIKPGNRLFNQPITEAAEIADRYYEKTFGRTRPKFYGTRSIDKERAKRISDAFIKIVDNPTAPDVRKAYEAMARETLDQYEFMLDAGYVVEINNDEPYANSREMIEDLRENKRMKIFSTESGFGDEKITPEQRERNVLLRESGFFDVNGQPLLVNDVFRAVHDFFGHSELGNSFGAIGEENAWNVHARMYSELARQAMTTETRGQNSYVNFSGVNDRVEAMRKEAANLREQGKLEEAEALVGKIYEEISFAEQKQGILPKEFWDVDTNDIGDKEFQPSSVDSILATEVGVQNGLTQNEFIDAAAQGDVSNATKLANFLNKSFPGVTISTDKVSFDNVMAQVGTEMYMRGDQVIYGVTVDGDIYINPDVHNSESALFNTTIHEFGHVWTDYLQTSEKGKKIYNRGAQLIEQGIANDENVKQIFEAQMKKYPGDRARAINETMAILIGNKGESITNKAVKSNFKEWLLDVWKFIKQSFKMSQDLTEEEIQNLTLDQFIGTALADIFSGKEISMTEAQKKQLKNPEAMFSNTQSMQSIIQQARANGFSDAAIKQVLLNRGFKASDINNALVVQIDITTDLPREFANVEGGVQKGYQLFTEVRAALQRFAHMGPRGGIRREQTKTWGEIREKAIELLKANPIFQAQSDTVQMELISAFDRSLGTQANTNVTRQISAIRNNLRQRKIGAKELQQAKIAVKNLIRSVLPKSDMYSQAQINKLISIISNATESSILADTEKVMKIVEQQRAKMKNSVLKKMLELVNKKAKAAMTTTGKRRSRGLDAEGQAFFAQVKPILRAVMNNDIQFMLNMATELAQADADGSINEAIMKQSRGEQLTVQEQTLLNKAYAFDTFGDLMSMELEDVQQLLSELEDARAESIQRLKTRREVRAMRYAALNEQATAQVSELNPELFVEETDANGNVTVRPKSRNELIQDRAAIRRAFQQGKIWSGFKQIVARWDYTSITGIKDFFRKRILHLGSLVNLFDNEAKGMTFFRDNIYRPLNRMDERSKVGYFREMTNLDSIANSIPGITKGYKQIRNMLQTGVHEFTINGQKQIYNADKLLRIYALSLNDVQRGKLKQMGWDDAQIQKIKSIVGPEPIEFADKLVDYFSNDYYESINNVYSHVNDVNLGYVPNYFPTITQSQKVDSKLLEDGDFNGIFNAETAPALKERSDVSGLIELNYDFSDVVESHFVTMEKYKAYAEGVKDLNAIFQTPAFNVLLEESDLKTVVKRSVNFAITPNAGQKEQQTALGKLMTKFTGFALAFKAVQIPKQATSFFNAYEDYSYFPADSKIPGVIKGPIDLMMFMVDSAKVMATMPKQVRKAYGMSANVRDRLLKGIEGDVYGLESGSNVFSSIDKRTDIWAKAVRAFKTGAAGPTVLGDILGVMGYMVNYNRNIANGMTQADALEAFNNYNATAQSRRGTEKISLQQNQNELSRAFTMFGSTTFLQINKVLTAQTNIFRALKNGQMPSSKDIRAFALNLGITNALFVGTANLAKFIKGDDDDRDEVLKQMGKALIGLNLIESIPLIGAAVETALADIEGERTRGGDNVVNPYMQVYKKIKKASEEEVGFKSVQPLVEIVIGAQLDPFIGVYNGVQDGFDENAIYDMLGISKSYRPTEEKEKSTAAPKGMGKEDMKRYFPEMYDQMYGPGSVNADADEQLKAYEKSIDDELQRQKDAAYNYIPKPKEKK